MTDCNATLHWWTWEAIQDTKTDVLIVTAGLGSGKTHGGVQWHYDRCAKNKDAKFSVFVEPTYARIDDTAIPTWKKVLTEFGLVNGIHYEFINSKPQKLRLLVTGQEVHFLSGDRPENIVGVEYSHATIDETGTQPKLTVDRVFERVRDPKAKYWQKLLIGAPQGINHFAEKYDSDTLAGWDTSVERDHRKEVYNKDTKQTTRYRRFRVTTFDNKEFLPDNYIQNLYDTHSHNPNLIKSYVYGYFCPLVEGVAASNYIPAIHRIKDVEADPSLDIFLTWDFNANSRLAWVGFQRIPFFENGERLHRYVGIHEAEQGYAQLDDACLDFAVKFNRDKFRDTPIYIYGDSSGHAKSHKIKGSDYDNVKEYLKRMGFTRVQICAAKSNPLEHESVEALQKAFKNDVLYISESLTRSHRSLLATTWKKNERKIDKPKEDDWTDFFDAIKYFAYEKIKNQTTKKPKGKQQINEYL